MKRVLRPNRPIYWLACSVVSIFCKVFFKLRIIKKRMDDIEAPVVVIANHISNMDALLVASALRPLHLHFVTAAYHFRNPRIRWLVKLLGCIRKEQFFSDYRCVRQMIDVVSRGEGVVIFPSGQSTFTGETTYIGRGIVPLIKKLGVPVVNVHTQGAHIGFPKWNMTALRKSRVEVHAEPLLSAEQIQSLSDDAIYEIIADALYFDDYEWQRKAMIKAARPRKTEGLQKFLFRCPKCKAEFTMRAVKNRLYCTACGNAAVMDEYGFLRPENAQCVVFETPPQWNRWQFDEYRLLVTPDFVYGETCDLLKVDAGGKYRNVGAGRVEMHVDSVRFQGQYNGEDVEWTVDNSLSAVFPHEKQKSFDVMVNGELFSFAPPQVQMVFKFILLKELIYKVYFEKK